MNSKNTTRPVTRSVQMTFTDSKGVARTHVIGSGNLTIMAGPCSIESKEHLLEVGTEVKKAGATFLRGGIYKMRTSPDAFQGLGLNALSFIKDVKRDLGMPIVSEITDPRQLGDFVEAVDMFQVGSRNMYNYELLKELGQTQTPVLLKRAFAATVDEWIKAADYVIKGGNENVLLCERGIRTFEPTTRNTLDLNSVAYLKAHTSFPVVVDPSHGTGRPELILPMSLAGVAAGADAIIVEVHPRPKEALSDGHQALTYPQFQTIVEQVTKVANALGRQVETP